MPMTLPIAAARISRYIQSTEHSFDRAVQDSSALMCELATARIESGIEAAAGQAAFIRLAKAQSLLIDAQNEVLRTHALLRDLACERADIPDVCPVTGGADRAAA